MACCLVKLSRRERLEAEEFHLFVIGDDKRSAQAELRKHFAALVEGYALEDDSQLAPSGKRLKERLLGRIRLV